MRHIDRLPKPKILATKEAEWQRKYNQRLTKEPHSRPDSTKYAHSDIRDTLRAMSFKKCFYCESLLSGEASEVDHFIEVAIDHNKAFDWNNLYLACGNCNDKLNHLVVPVDVVLDPCSHSDSEIQSDISYNDEQIFAVNASERGLKTIKKFKLNSDVMDLKRGRWLRKLANEIIEIHNTMFSEGRKAMNPTERNTILHYLSPDQPYSLMCEVYLKKRCKDLFVSP